MNPYATYLSLFLSLGMLLRPALGRGDETPRWTISRFAEPPITWDGCHVMEGTSAAPPLSWHGRLSTTTLYNIGRSDRSAQVRGTVVFGLGLPLGLEAALSFPVAATFATPIAAAGMDLDEPTLQDMGEDGPGIGDLTGALLLSALDATEGGFGLLFGVKASAPTGYHERLMGEGGFGFEPFAVLAFQVLGNRLSLNLGYRFRPEHREVADHQHFEQDDDLIWRVGIRVVRKFDIAWSVQAEGAVGVATEEGIWPKAASRPVWIGAGIDFPVGRSHRFGTLIGSGITGEAAPAFTFGFRFSWLPVMPDEDEDGVMGRNDACPILKEDKDGYLDTDGCPDLDNDMDGFPDDEDKCPLKAASDFSEDGC
ncbi:MAG: thrombospondin type 3 repeat-containing protein [Myxococcota bacterium]|nr:thrombospondin type 3 repeat-containing protein [Myxococcota bacterium]